MGVRNLVLTLFEILAVEPIIQVSMTQTLQWTPGQIFQTVRGVDITGPQVMTTLPNVNSVGHCTTVCSQTPTCASVAYNLAIKTCKLSQQASLHAQNSIIDDPDSSYVVIGKESDWRLTFRATKGINKSVLDAWNREGYHDDKSLASDIPAGCFTKDGRLPCDRHYRTSILDNWHDIEAAKFAFYTDGQEVISVTFNATGSARPSHVFAISRIIQSSIPELVNYNGPVKHNSVTAYEECSRRFYLQKSFGGCFDDHGWMFVNDVIAQSPCCHYELFATYPRFVYTGTGSSIIFGQPGTMQADVFAVFVKFSNDNK